MTPGSVRPLIERLFARRTPEDDFEAHGSVAPPPLPLAKRLNRNALTVAAVLMGITVITSLVVFNTGNRATPANSGASAPATYPPAQPTFLDRPVRGAQPGASATFGLDSSAASTGVPMTRSIAGPVRYVQSSGTSAGLPAVGDHDPLAPNDQPGRLGAEQRRERAFAAALARSAVAGAPDGAAAASDMLNGASPRAVASSSTANAEDRFLAFSDSVVRNSVRAVSGGTSMPAAGPSLLTSTRRAFLKESGDLGGASVIARLEPSGSPYTLRAGTVIPGVLLTAITSTLPGDCVGQVARDVFDSKTQRILLIPKGSKLICRYDDQVAAGQGRLLVAWTRLVLPDGRSMTLPGLALKDRQGQTGAPGKVDSHTSRVFGNALLLSAVSAGAQLSQTPQASILTAPSYGQVAAGALGQELSSVALEILRRGMSQPPTITVPQGQSFNVFLNGDLVFDGPYVPESEER